MEIDTNLSWQYHVNDIPIKLNRANALLFKMRKYVSPKGYLRYKTITSQNVPSEVPIKNFFVS